MFVQKLKYLAILAVATVPVWSAEACGLEHLAYNPSLRKLASGDYDYKEKGPEKWAALFENCAQKEQSPIDIPTDVSSFTDIVSDPLKKNVLETGITVSYFPETETENNATLSIVHGKYTVVVPYTNHPSQATSPQLSELVGRAEGALTPDTSASWVLEQFHFHWGEDNQEGSEHTLDGKSEALEVHLVHRNAKYDSLGEALGKSDGLMVIGRLFEAGESENAEIDVLLSSIAASDSFTPGESAPLLQPFSVSDMTFGAGLDGQPVTEFYTYAGSLTTPTCDESVTWVVLASKGTVSESQMAAFREIQGGNPDNLHAILRNWRDVQELNERTVYNSVSLRSLTGTVAGNTEAPTESPEESEDTPLAAVLLGTLGGFVVIIGLLLIWQRSGSSSQEQTPEKAGANDPAKSDELNKV